MRTEHGMPLATRGDEMTHLIVGTVQLIVWAVIIYGLVVLILRYAQSQGWGQAKHQQDALDIVEMRYAKGEITKEQFHQIKKDLSITQ